MPNLENLKKQAKLVLRWHRDRYYPVAAQIRAVLPRYRHLSDREILAASFKLSDAQELVARQAGFESWQALKSGIDAMPQQTERTQTKPAISATAAELFVSDIKASCDFFTQKLGFSIVFVYGEPASQTVTDAWGGGRLFYRALADAGYVVVSVDNRGTPAPRGAAWRKIAYGAIGDLS